MLTQRAWFQFWIILIGIFFEFMGTGYDHADFFPLVNYQESIRGYIYNDFEHVKFIMLALLAWRFPAMAADYKTDGLFVVLAILDFGDYLLTGNNVWFGIKLSDTYKAQFPVSMNTISLAVFFLYANKQWRMNGSQELY
jgi:hypothetical protein